MKIKLLFSLVLIFLQTNFAFAKTISKQDVISSALKNYPTILSAYEKIEAQSGSMLAAQGFFDIRLKQNYYNKTRGFYDSQTFDTLLEQEIGFMSGKIYGGFRKSFGSFANYDGALQTNAGGEYRAGAKFSLLKNRDIDSNRLGIILASLGSKEAQIQLTKIKLEIERDATKAYFKWLVAGKIFHIYEELYKLANKRQSQFEERAKKGDIAQFLVIENKKNVLRRSTALAKAKQEFENSAIYLSLFWRDDIGKPAVATPSQLPKDDFKLPNSIEKPEDLEFALLQRVEMQMIKIKKEQNLNELNYAKNLLAPQLDVDFGASKDLGSGTQAKSQSNNYVGLNFELPLQRREGEGKKVEFEATANLLKFEQQLIEEKIIAEISALKIQLKNMIQMHENLEHEAHLAKLLEEGELQKFKAGASNFFLVNLREQDSAMSQAAAIEMFEKYQDALADYKMLTCR